MNMHLPENWLLAIGSFGKLFSGQKMEEVYVQLSTKKKGCFLRALGFVFFH